MVGVDGVNGGGGDKTEVDPGVVGADIGAGDKIGNCFVAAPPLVVPDGVGAGCNGGGVTTTCATRLELDPLLPLLRRSRRFTAFSMILVQSNIESGTSV